MTGNPDVAQSEAPSHLLGDANVALIATLMADAARATMLFAVSDGRALPAGELARAARVSPATASGHLAKLLNGGLLVAERHGRHRYYKLADPAVVHALEALAAVGPAARAKSLKDAHVAKGIRLARTCYDHLAGTLGVAVTDAAIDRGALVLEGREYAITTVGASLFAAIGIDTVSVASNAMRTRRPITRACLDWSERRYHIAGALGAALATRLIDLAWLERTPASRALRITNEGRRALWKYFGVRL